MNAFKLVEDGIRKQEASMIRTAIIFIGLVLTSISGYAAESWKAVFVTEDGSRIDYFKGKLSFISSSDKATAYRFEFVVPPGETTATIRLLPVGENTNPSEDYKAIIISRSEDMVVLIMVNEGLSRGDKFEGYSLFPKIGVGYIIETNSYYGRPEMKTRANSNPNIPAASAKAFPLRRIDIHGKPW